MKAKNTGRPQRLKNNRHFGRFAPLIFLIFGLATLSLALSFSKKEEAKMVIKTTPEDEMIAIPMPSRNISRGENIRDVEFVARKWPKSQLSTEYITSLTEYHNAITLTVLPKHLPVLKSSLSLTRQDSNAVVEGIPEGMRAITVKVDAESAVEGWARSGNFVDVIVIRNAQDSALGLESKVIAENVKILSAGRSANPSDSNATTAQPPATATLLVSQEDALKIKTAANVGKLTFSLRGAGDQAPTIALAMDQKRLLGGAKTIEAKNTVIKGRAQGPDGKQYILTDKSEWLKSAPEETKGNKDSDA